MHCELLELLLQTTETDALVALIHTHNLNITTIQTLKNQMEALQSVELAEGMRIAQLAYRLSLHMPAPAPALGRWTLANALFYAAHYSEAAQLYQQTRAEYLAQGYALEAARMSVGQVFVLAYTGESEAALALASETEAILAESSQTEPADLMRLGSLFMNVGVVHDLLGQYEDALAVYTRLAPIATQLNDQLMLGQVTHNQAYAFGQIGALAEALAAYRQAEVIFLATNAKYDLARLYINLSQLLGRYERYVEANEVQDKAEQQLLGLEGMEQPRHRLTLLRTLFYLQSNRPIDPALLDALRRAQAAFAQHGPVLEEGLALILLGRCHLRSGRWEMARQTFEAAQALSEKGADRALGYRILYGLGEVERAQNHLEKAIGYYTAAIQQVESIRYELQVETFRAGFLTDKIEIYQELADVYRQSGNLALAFQVVEWAKSRLVTEKLAFRLTSEVNQAIHSDDGEIRELAQQLAAALQTLDSLYDQARLETMQSREDITLAPLRQTTILVAELETTVQTLVQQIQRRQPLFSALTAGYTSSLPKVQACLREAIFLQYHVVKDQVFVFIVDRAGIQQHCKLAKLADIDHARHAFITAVERLLEISVRFGPQKTLRYLPALLDDANKHLKALYGLLIQPILAFLPAKRPLIISPDGPLAYIPFHSLYDGQTYLIEHRAISYTPSATILDLCTQPKAASAGILLFGYDSKHLQSVSVELNRLAQLFPTAERYSGEQATTTTFIARVQHQQRVHLAAHATFRADNPMLSSIALADRRLTLAEIARLQINADLVVLSGCETGYGQLHGTDLLSLASGFLGAGARSLLVSFWRVEDSATANLMQHFYQAILAGQEHASALQTAQIALLNQGRQSKEDTVYCHPAFWAPFTLVGKP
ncbi:hypothetical protein BH10CHL1_BH10CHL1_23630 [soil metagenome]